MRAVMGLAAVLITLGVIVVVMYYVELPSMQQAAQVQKQVKPQAQQIAGQDIDGRDARDTIQLASESTRGKMTSVVVTGLSPGGAMQRYFGLQKNDSIVSISMEGGVMQPVKDMSSASEAKDSLLMAYQNGQQIEVVRGDQHLTLPSNPGLGSKYGAAAQSAPKGPAAGNGGAGGNALQRPLDAIQHSQ